MRRWRSALTNLPIDQPVRRSIQRLTARAANTMVSRSLSLRLSRTNEVDDLADGRLGVHSVEEGDELLAGDDADRPRRRAPGARFEGGEQAS